MNAEQREQAAGISPILQIIWGTIGLLALALVVRALVYFRVEDVLHADEAIQGLMARHILGREIQLFTYGLPYLGTLQAHWIAAWFAALGPSTVVLKWAAGFESLLLVWGNYLLAREAGGGDRRAGFLAALLTAVGPLYLIEWSLRPRGGYLEVATVAAFAFWALLKAVRAANAGEGPDKPRSIAPALSLAAGAFLLGLGWWVHLTMFYAILAFAIVFVVWSGRLRRNVRAILAAAVCFLIGGAPFWLYNLKYPGRTFEYLLAEARVKGLGAGVLKQLGETVGNSIPILLGSHQTEAWESFGAPAVGLSVLAYAVAILAAIGAFRGAAADARGSKGPAPGARAGVGLLLIFSAIALGAFALGPFADETLDPRSLLPLYCALPTLAGIGISRLWAGRGIGRPAAIVLAALLLVVHLTGYRRADQAIIQPFAYEARVPATLEPLRLFLETNRITRVFTNFHVGYRLAFETGENVLACTEGDPFPERYPPYAETVRKAEPAPSFIVGARFAVLLESAMRARGINTKSTTIQDFHVIQPLNGRYLDYPPQGIGPFIPAAFEITSAPRQCGPGERFVVETTVLNRSATAWPALNRSCIAELSYHLVDAATGRMVRYDNPRFALNEEGVGPGRAVTVKLELEAPKQPGRYAFVPDLVVEQVAWFSDLQKDLLARSNWHEFEVLGSR